MCEADDLDVEYLRDLVDDEYEIVDWFRKMLDEDPDVRDHVLNRYLYDWCFEFIGVHQHDYLYQLRGTEGRGGALFSEEEIDALCKQYLAEARNQKKE